MSKTFNEWAKFWFYIIGINIIPAISKKKIPLVKWIEYQTNPISEKQFKEWIDNNTFKDGLAIICGKVWRGEHKDKWLNGIDCDNKIGLDKMCSSGIKKVAEMTIVEQHANKNKCHIYFYTKEPIKSKVANDGKNNTVPQIEIKSEGKLLLYCSGGLHKDNSLIDILGINKVKTVDKENLENKINDICKEYNIPYLDNGITTTRETDSINQELKDKFIRNEIPNKAESNDFYFYAAIVCQEDGLTKKEAEEKIKPNYNEWAKSKQFSGREWSNIKTKINDVYKTPAKKKIELPATIQIYDIGMKLIEESVKNKNDTEQIVIKVKLHGKYHWIDIFSNTFTQMIRLENQKQHHKIYADSTYLTAIKSIHAYFLLNNTIIKPIFNRCALIDNVLYYDLQDNDGTIHKISKDGISEAQNDDDIPIFLKSPSAKTFTSAQPKPLFDNDEALNELVKLIRILDKDKIILKSHLICFYLTDFPIPLGIFHGEQGSAKTSTSSGIKSIIDPEGECALSLPDKVDDLAIGLSKRGLSNFDNIDNFSKEISQFLCKAVTGTQYNKRQLFSNGEEFSLILKSKIMLNGITPTIDQPDLLERSLFYELAAISKAERMTDAKFLKKFNELKPHVLGFIFKIIQKAMIIYDEVDKELDGKSLPRMASFAVWGEAISRSLGYEKNKFIERYDEKIIDSNLILSEEFPIVQPLIDYIGEKENLELTVSKLFSAIVNLDKLKTDERLPKDSNRLGKQLKQLAPTLRTLGFNVMTSNYNKRDGKFPRGSSIVSIIKISEDGLVKYT